MRNLHELDSWRIETPDIMERYGSYGDDKAGAFFVYPPGPDQTPCLKVLASYGDGWEHVSVSVRDRPRTPTWAEMDWVKRTFFNPNEVVVQFHPAEADHISIHPYVLHLWRPLDYEFTMPPKWFV